MAQYGARLRALAAATTGMSGVALAGWSSRVGSGAGAFLAGAAALVSPAVA
ncbi:MAG: hypothetical protein IPG97_16975 [Microthrixaceae bacterium]|nr:hypothetical protein [Microthrixaceae bacterium]